MEEAVEVAVAGWCKECGQNVWLDEQWGCVNGHPWNEITGWYDAESGAAVTPYWLQQQAATGAEVQQPGETGPAGEPTTEREQLLADIVAAFAGREGYSVRYGTDTDLVIDNGVADANWGLGREKVDYRAMLKAVEADRTVYFWEKLKEKDAHVGAGGLEAGSSATVGGKRWGKEKRIVFGPQGVVADYEWDYAATRKTIEEAAASRGWRVKVVALKGSAQW
jgi:hypothetical protein